MNQREIRKQIKALENEINCLLCRKPNKIIEKSVIMSGANPDQPSFEELLKGKMNMKKDYKTGKIAYHSLVMREDGGLDYVQYDFNEKEEERREFSPPCLARLLFLNKPNK